jgi:hypothetical protein
LAGAGAGEGDVMDRAGSAATGAAVGGVLGGAIPPVAAAAPHAYRFARGVFNVVTPRGTRAPAGFTPTGSPIEGAAFIADGSAPAAAGADEQALRLIADQLTRAGRTPADIERRLAELREARTYHSRGQAQGVVAPVDVDPALQSLAGSVSRAYPEARREIGAFIDARQTGLTPPTASAEALAGRGIPTVEKLGKPLTGAQAERAFGTSFDTPAGGTVPTGHVARIRDALRRAFLISDADYHGHRASGVRTVEAIVQRAEEQARDAFGAAYGAARGQNLYGAVNDVFKRHIQQAALTQSTGMEADLRKVASLFLRPTRKTLELQQFQNVKRQLDAMIRDDLAKPKYVPRAGLLDQLRKDLLEAVDNATGGESSPYRLARQQFSDEMSMADAYLMGRKALDDKTRLRRTGPGREIAGTEITADTFSELTPGQQKLFRFGLLDAVSAGAMRKPKEREALAIFSTPRVQELLQAAIPRSERGAAAFANRPERFGRYLDFEKGMQDTRYAVRGNSATAERLQDDLALAGMEQLNRLRDLHKGSASAWDYGLRIVQWVADRAFGLNAEAAKEIARFLFTANQAQQQDFLRRLAAIMPADRMQRFNQLLGQVAGAGGMQAGAIVGGAASGPVQL